MIDDERKRRLEAALKVAQGAGNVYLAKSIHLALQRLLKGSP